MFVCLDKPRGQLGERTAWTSVHVPSGMDTSSDSSKGKAPLFWHVDALHVHILVFETE